MAVFAHITISLWSKLSLEQLPVILLLYHYTFALGFVDGNDPFIMCKGIIYTTDVVTLTVKPLCLAVCPGETRYI